jgi:hypothetical protein
MRRAMKLTVLTLICIFAFTSILGVASAGDDDPVGQIITTDHSGSTKSVLQFNLGDTVYVEYFIDTGKTADVVIFDLDAGHEVAGTLQTGLHDSGEFTFLPSHPGFYTVKVNGEDAEKFATAPFFVLPEVLGSVAALGAGLAAFGIIKFKYKKI